MIEKRISACVLLVAVMICLIGSVPVTVQAAASNKDAYDAMNYDYFVGDNLGDYKYSIQFIDAPSSYMYLLIKTISGNYGLYCISLEQFTYSEYYIVHYSNDVYATDMGSNIASAHSVVDKDGNNVTLYSSLLISFRGDASFTGFYSGTFDTSSLDYQDQLYQSFYDIYTGKTDIPGYTENIPDFTDDNAAYDGDLGYLQNVVFKLLNVYTTIGDTDITGGYETYLKFNWNTMTSSGVDLTDPDVNVQFMIKVQGTGKYLTGTEFNTSTHSSGYMTLCPEYSENNYSLLMAEGVTKSGEDSVYYSLRKQVRAQQPLISRTFDIKSSFYFRPVMYRDGWKYGGWTKVSLLYDETSGWSYDYDVVDGVTPDGTIPKDNLYNDDDGIIPDNSYSGSGSAGAGNTVDEAINNTTVITGGNSGDSSGDLVSNVRSMLSMITEIPAIIGALFSFLPGWCLTLLAVGVGLIMVLIVYKLIRG